MKCIQLQPEVWYAATVHRLIALNLILLLLSSGCGEGLVCTIRYPEWSSGKITHPNKLPPQKKSLRICVGGANVLWCYAPRASLMRFPFYRRVSVKLRLTECTKNTWMKMRSLFCLSENQINYRMWVAAIFISLVGSWRRAVGGFS